jgi:NAD(P)-dependent dehydrogenase (short-subunit alcohol dehydrogenase family)
VAIVTGAGGGLGRQHALALAARGAKVLVNDLGSGVHGEGGSVSPAQAVVDEAVAAESALPVARRWPMAPRSPTLRRSKPWCNRPSTPGAGWTFW